MMSSFVAIFLRSFFFDVTIMWLWVVGCGISRNMWQDRTPGTSTTTHVGVSSHHLDFENPPFEIAQKSVVVDDC